MGNEKERTGDEPRRPGVPPHQPAKDRERSEVDEAAEESFPASDPPAYGNPSTTGGDAA